MKNKIFDLIKPTLVLVCICLVISMALGATNLLTAERIAEQNEKKKTDALIQLLPDCKYEQLKTADGVEYYVASSNESGKIEGVIFSTAAKGYGGDITVMTAVGLDKTVLGVICVDLSGETVGLGQKAADKSFTDQFLGLIKGITVVKTEAGENEITAITGATITSKAVAAAVDQALESFEDTVFELEIGGAENE